MTKLSPGQCRAARALLGWTQRELEMRSRVTQKTIADFERGARTPFPRTLKDISEAFEAEGIFFIEPQEGVGGQGVRLVWGMEPALRQGSDDETESTRHSGRSKQALPNDPSLIALYEYWQNRPAEWREMSDPLRRAVLREIFGTLPDSDPILDNDQTISDATFNW